MRTAAKVFEREKAWGPSVMPEDDSFAKRRYTSLDQALDDLAYAMRNRRLMRRDAEAGLVTSDFRERLMLAVTSVNECRYCSYVHARSALREGVKADEVEALLCGSVEGCPVEEGTALLYAIHFSEERGRPDGEARERVVSAYGPERAAAIERALRMIYAGNMLGNTVDWLMHRLTGGRWTGTGRLIGARGFTHRLE